MADTDANAETHALNPADSSGEKPRVRIDSSDLKRSYCNVCNATGTREEVILNFGLNQSWDEGAEEAIVQLHHRIIMNPHAAKRLHGVLGQLLEQHEKHYGPLG